MIRKSPGLPPSQRPGYARKESAEQYDPDDVRYVAVHEAGHAVSAIILGLPLKSVDIKKRLLPNMEVSLGLTDVGPLEIGDADDKLKRAFTLLAYILAGSLAEIEVHSEFGQHKCHRGDMKPAERISQSAVGDTLPDDQEQLEAEAGALANAAYESATELVGACWPAILSVADELINRKSLTGSEVTEIMNAHRTKAG